MRYPVQTTRAVWAPGHGDGLVTRDGLRGGCGVQRRHSTKARPNSLWAIFSRPSQAMRGDERAALLKQGFSYTWKTERLLMWLSFTCICSQIHHKSNSTPLLSIKHNNKPISYFTSLLSTDWVKSRALWYACTLAGLLLLESIGPKFQLRMFAFVVF